MPEPRFAIYYAPPENSPIWQLASRWLGRNAVSGESSTPPLLHGFNEAQIQELTQFPRHYGFHTTLKPPFHLKEGMSLEGLSEELERFASRQTASALPPFQLSLLGSFIAVTLTEPSLELSAVADAAVSELDEFRRSPSPIELEKRRKGLTPRQNEMLDRWGYPYVFEEWQFHMSLASGLNDSELARRLLEQMNELFEPALADPMRLDSVCLYGQPTREEPLTLLKRFSFPE